MKHLLKKRRSLNWGWMESLILRVCPHGVTLSCTWFSMQINEMYYTWIGSNNSLQAKYNSEIPFMRLRPQISRENLITTCSYHVIVFVSSRRRTRQRQGEQGGRHVTNTCVSTSLSFRHPQRTHPMEIPRPDVSWLINDLVDTTWRNGGCNCNVSRKKSL